MQSFNVVLRVVFVGSLLLGGCSSADDPTITSTDTDTSASTAEAVTSTKQCKGALPQHCQVCADGTSACAHWVVKKGVCAIETCPSAPPLPGPLPAPGCVTASDCGGALPALAMQCKDGTTATAHHVCTAGVCGIEICPK